MKATYLQRTATEKDRLELAAFGGLNLKLSQHCKDRMIERKIYISEVSEALRARNLSYIVVAISRGQVLDMRLSFHTEKLGIVYKPKFGVVLTAWKFQSHDRDRPRGRELYGDLQKLLTKLVKGV